MSLLDTASLIVTPNGYKEGKLYSVIPSDGSGDLSVTRATTATRVNSQGFVELVPYNIVQYSEQFDNAAWTKARGSVTANATTAPNGTTTADKFVPDTQVNPHFIYQSASNLSTGERYTSSVYAKISEWNSVAIFRMDSSVGVSFRLDTQAATVLVGSPISYSITSVGNGWYRLDVCFAAGSASDGVQIRIGNNSSYGIAGNNSNGLFLWGAQLVEGSLAKDYQKTETRLNIPRLDYSNGTCPSILVEPQRTNLLTWSSSFDNAAWTMFNGSVTANQTTAPDGTNTADKITMGGAGSATLRQNISGVSNGTIVTFSLYIKQGSGVTAFLDISDTKSTVDITPTANWVRYTYSVAFNTTLNFIDIELRGASGTAFCYIWGAQVEVGSYATSYIPTTSASVTRNADVISKTGISSLIGQTEGTIFLDFVLKNPLSATNRIISITEPFWPDGSIRLDIDYNKFTADFVNGGTTVGGIGYFTAVQPNTRYKVAIAYKVNDCQMYINGVDAGSDTTTTAMPTCSEFYLNALGAGFNAPYEASNINAAALWKTRLTNTQLAQLTAL